MGRLAAEEGKPLSARRSGEFAGRLVRGRTRQLGRALLERLAAREGIPLSAQRSGVLASRGMRAGHLGRLCAR